VVHHEFKMRGLQASRGAGGSGGVSMSVYKSEVCLGLQGAIVGLQRGHKGLLFIGHAPGLAGRARHSQEGQYTVKKVNNFPVPSLDVTNQTLPGREILSYSRLGTEKSLTFFYSVENIYGSLWGGGGGSENGLV
jgi:hypothetical protein